MDRRPLGKNEYSLQQLLGQCGEICTAPRSVNTKVGKTGGSGCMEDIEEGGRAVRLWGEFFRNEIVSGTIHPN